MHHVRWSERLIKSLDILNRKSGNKGKQETGMIFHEKKIPASIAVALVVPDIDVKSFPCLICISIARKITYRVIRHAIYVLLVVVDFHQCEVIVLTVNVQGVKVHIRQEFAVKATESPELVILGFDVIGQFAAAYLCGGPLRQHQQDHCREKF